jgi:hypothetical protein
MSKTMFNAIKRVSVLCGLEPKDFSIYFQTPQHIGNKKRGISILQCSY